MVFLVCQTLTEEDRTGCRKAAERWCKSVHRPPEGWGSRIFICLYLTALSCFVLGLLLKVNGSIWNPFGIFVMVCALVNWVMYWPRPLRAPVFFKPEPAPEWQDIPLRVIFFGDGSFSVWTPTERTRLGYSSISSAWEDEGRFYLFFQDHPPLIVRKSGLGRWMPEDFRDFLELELGCPIERIK